MDKDKPSKIQTIIFTIAIVIMSGCFIFMGVQSIRESKSQVTINISEETTTAFETTSATKKTAVTTKSSGTERWNTEITTESVTIAVDFPININTADEEKLMLLEGIGEALSSRIVEYRNENGYFNNVEEIMNVPGIGNGIFNDISKYIYVEDPYYPTEPAQIEPISEVEPVYEYEEETEPEITVTLEDVAPIELNSANAELLMLLPYVDEIIAGEIIELRASIGGFSHPYELLYVEELTQEQVAEIMEYVYVAAV